MLSVTLDEEKSGPLSLAQGYQSNKLFQKKSKQLKGGSIEENGISRAFVSRKEHVETPGVN